MTHIPCKEDSAWEPDGPNTMAHQLPGTCPILHSPELAFHAPMAKFQMTPISDQLRVHLRNPMQSSSLKTHRRLPSPEPSEFTLPLYLEGTGAASSSFTESQPPKSQIAQPCSHCQCSKEGSRRSLSPAFKNMCLSLPSISS
jgi:hypothetical protein